MFASSSSNYEMVNLHLEERFSSQPQRLAFGDDMRDGEPPRLCYTDPSGVLRGPFDEWRILEWYRQGFFANTILFNLENDDVNKFSLGDLIERFGRDNPFASRSNWQTSRLNGTTSTAEQAPKHEGNQQFVCTECRRNGERLDALLTAVHRIQNVLEVNTQNVADNTTAIASLRAMLEESRLSAWKWNSSDINSEPQQKLPALPTFADILSKSDSGIVPNESFSKKASPDKEVLQENGGGNEVDEKVLGKDWPVKGFAKETNPGDDLASLEKSSTKSLQLDSFVSAELMKMQSVPAATKKQDQGKIKKKSNGNSTEKNGHPHFTLPDSVKAEDMRNDAKAGPEDLHKNTNQAHENDWINANTKPSFHPFPGATTPGVVQPMMVQGGGMPKWSTGVNANVGSPHHFNYNHGQNVTPMTSTWGQNSFAPLQMAYRTPASPPTQTNPPTFAAAALKEKKEINPPRKPETEESGPRLVPVGRNPPRMIMRRAPTNKQI
ncbi:unnamed protein product, partial [Mesorhabditis belari]|uniref:GYF domain-containing protein n=1 Tax=Mesorhabditis belari TaxID=2138241 RepID=A0AAF3F168_9BILA